MIPAKYTPVYILQWKSGYKVPGNNPAHILEIARQCNDTRYGARKIYAKRIVIH